jgi:hypothetical protein
MPIKSKFGHWTTPVQVKTADYTIVPSDFGTLFTNRGDTGAIVFTLPAAKPEFNGCWVDFMVIADQDFTVAGTAGELVVFNDLAANSVAFSTNTEQIGSGMKATCDGTSWLIRLSLGSETVTPTIAT